MSTPTQTASTRRAIDPAEFDYHRARAATLRAAAISDALGSLFGYVAGLFRTAPAHARRQVARPLDAKLVTAK